MISQREVHDGELGVCPEGRDASPDPSGGNYTADALVLALQRHGLSVSFGRNTTAAPPRRGHRVVGYLVGTGRAS